MIEKYGVEHALQSKEIQNKLKETCKKSLWCKSPCTK